jgi:hypothetical protein
MKTIVKVLIVTVTLSVTACDSCGGQPSMSDAGTVGKGVVYPPDYAVPSKQPTKVHKTTPAIMQEASVLEKSGDVVITRSEATAKTPGFEGQDDSLFVGDSIVTGQDGAAVLDIGQETKMSMGASAKLSIGTHRPMEMILHRGVFTLEGTAIRGLTRRFKLMTPGGVVFYAGPAMTVAIGADGVVRVDVTDCPLHEPPPTSLQQKGKQYDPQPRCSFLSATEEENLVTADRIVIGTDLSVGRSQIAEGDQDAAQWVTERDAKLAEDPGPVASSFAAWLVPAIEEVHGFMQELVERRAKNKELIQTLRDLRKAGKPDPSSKVEGMAGQDDEVARVKEELRDNSGAQYKLRQLMLARYHQVVLRLELLSSHLDDDLLAKSGKTLDAVNEDVEGLDAQLFELVSRKPQHKMPPKMMPGNLLKKALPSPKKPVIQ